MNTPFDLDAFISGINEDKSKKKSKKDRLNKVLMNTKDNQGTLTLIPIISKATGNIYQKLPKVYEFYGDTSLIDNGEAWYRILPLDYYGQLTEAQVQLYHEVKGYLDLLSENEEVSYEEFRVRNYVLVTGICLGLKNTEGKVNEELIDCPCLFVYNSNTVIDQLSTAISTKTDAMKGNREWITYIVTPANKGRQGVIQINYVKAAGPGYDASVTFELNSPFSQIIDPDREISDETFGYFDEILSVFLGWIYDSKNKSYFNEVAFKELRDQLYQRCVSSGLISLGTTANATQADTVVPAEENKNNLTPSAPTSSAAPKGAPF